MKIILTLFVCAMTINSQGGSMATEAAGRIEEGVLKATIKIETPAGTFGTGFIVSKPAGIDTRYFFLVTNKHLIGDYSLIDGKLDSYYDFIKIYVYKKDASIQKIEIPLKNKEGKINNQKVLPHPEQYIDVAIISIAEELEKVSGIDKWSFDLSYLATDEMLKNWNVNMGDQVFALGYPYNIYSRSNNYPIAKFGCISSKIGEEIIVILNYEDKNKNKQLRELKGKIILLDGTLVDGNSGGPIVIPRGRRERSKVNSNKVEFTTGSIPNLVIGVQSQSLVEAGISLAFSSEYILELINKLSQNK